MQNNSSMWISAVKAERPWESNEITDDLLSQVKDEDMAAVIWAYFKKKSVKCLSEKMPSLGGSKIENLLPTEEGRKQIWRMLEQAGAWL